MAQTNGTSPAPKPTPNPPPAPHYADLLAARADDLVAALLASGGWGPTTDGPETYEVAQAIQAPGPKGVPYKVRIHLAVSLQVETDRTAPKGGPR